MGTASVSDIFVTQTTEWHSFQSCCRLARKLLWGTMWHFFFNQYYLGKWTGEKKQKYFSIMFFMQYNQKVLWVDACAHVRTFTILPSKKYLFSTIMYWCLDTHVHTHSSLLKSFHLQLQFSHLCKEVWLLENLHPLLLVPLSFLSPCF